MQNTILFSFPENIVLSDNLVSKLQMEYGIADIRHFPDGESYIRIHSDVKNKTVILIADLSHPDQKTLAFMFMTQTIKKLGAKKICLVLPYLPYMRQDKQFTPGEAITSSLFAKFISSEIDYLITIDPHLHRIHDLSEIYPISTIKTLHATKVIADWIQHNIDSPVLIGPDEESRQWVAEIAKFINSTYVICNKIRHDDRNVSITIPAINQAGGVAVLVDDIISTGSSMLEIIQQIALQGFQLPVCIGVHALFNQESEEKLMHAGSGQIITCNTISHPTNKIDVSDLIAKAIVEIMAS